ncbi:MAG: DUF4625 domain-containing protein [Bacteroidetes bacterium]|nr:DUF4625 domain-containing protein [Bacteroidota bacterium]
MKKTIFLSLIIVLSFVACNEKNDVDTQKPQIDMTIDGASPLNCQTIYYGEPFKFKALFKDNDALGSYSIGLHNNFDNHSHTTEINECAHDAIKDAVNPFIFSKEYMIDKDKKESLVEFEMCFDKGNDKGNFDDGDYHFFISLTDKNGWSQKKGLSIKLLHR